MTIEFAESGLRLECGSVAQLTLNRPPRRNAMTAAMWAAVPEICDILTSDGTKALIVNGTGDEAFSAGADISEFEAVYGTPEATAAYNRNVRAAQARLRDIPLPTIAEISGVCYGGGCGLALACDFRIADLGASFAITPARLGLAYSPADTWQLIEKVGISRAKDLLMTGRSVNAEEALTIGLIDRLEQDVVVASTALGDHFAGLAPAALKAIKAITNGLSELSNRPDLQAAFEGTFSGAEFREGFRAFLEKRAPDFGGER